MDATYISATSFTVAGDQTTIFLAGRAVKMSCGVDGVKYGWVASSAYTTLTTVILQAGSDAITNNLTSVEWSSLLPKGCSAKVLIGRHRISASELGKNPKNPPISDTYGITGVLEFGLNGDQAQYKYPLPPDYAGGDITVHFHWTKSTANDDQSGKHVKWQLKYLMIDGETENCNSGESTDSVEDEYESAVTTTQIVYKTESITIADDSFIPHDILIMQIMAITPAGAALDDAPALVAIDIEIPVFQTQRDES